MPETKVSKLLQAVQQVLKSNPCSRKDLEVLIGLLHWILQLAPSLRPWLCTMYHDKARPLGANFSLPQAAWQQIRSFLRADLLFVSTPPGTSIRPGSKLLSVRHVPINDMVDLLRVRNTGKRLWARVADPSTGKRRLSSTSLQFLQFWQTWCLGPQVFRPLACSPFDTSVSLAADACASCDHIGIGGWVAFAGQPRIWFSEAFCVSDFTELGLPMKAEANLDIVSYETLSQIALMLCFASACVGGRLRICIPSWSDINSGTEAVANKLFTTVVPLCYSAQRLATLAWRAAVSLDCSHISGCHNEKADWLSRWNGADSLPPEWRPEHRIRLPLSMLREGKRDIRLFPSDARLLWQPPLPAFS